MMQRKLVLLPIALILAMVLSVIGVGTSFSPAYAEKITHRLVTLDTRAGVTQTFVVLKPENPKASIILFSGLFGNIKAGGKENKPKIRWEKSWMVKARQQFAEHGLIVAVIDAPSDHKKSGSSGHKRAPGMGLDWRLADGHMQDINAVINYLEKENLPIFLAGQSLGTLSVATAGYKLGGEVKGIILSSSATKAKPPWKEKWPVYKDYPNAILDFPFLNKISVPVMVLAHEKDNCVPTPPANAQRLKDAFTGSSNAVLQLYSGGRPLENGCSAAGAHSYYGIQKQVIADICDFIKRHAQ